VHAGTIRGHATREKPLMPVRVVVQGGPYRGVSKTSVSALARTMLSALQMEECELSIVLMNDNQIQDLNRIYRRKNRPTDVLAFSQREGPYGAEAGTLLGDVVVSVPTARRQARARGATLREELTMLVAHGLLHLLGWDHQTESADRRMRKETERLCMAAAGALQRQARLKGKTRKGTKRGKRTRSASRRGP
jgi:probable rRNA maturation factor